MNKIDLGCLGIMLEFVGIIALLKLAMIIWNM